MWVDRRTASGGTPHGVTASSLRGQDQIERVSTLELFFDLVFVFTITQLTGLLVHDPDLLHLLRVAVLLAIIFWMYGGYAWLTNAVAADTTARRLVLLGGMAGFLLVSLTVPRHSRAAGWHSAWRTPSWCWSISDCSAEPSGCARRAILFGLGCSMLRAPR
jgi:low temperature requirement protein LtrA